MSLGMCLNSSVGVGLKTMALRKETDYVPTMKYASGFEIWEHAQRIAENFEVLRPGQSGVHSSPQMPA